MDIKKKEFLNLTQGNRDVMAYVNAFNTLSQYAPEEVATDAKKQERLYDGLSAELQDKLSTTKFEDFNDLVNITIRAEHKIKNLEAKNKRPALTSAGGSSSRPRLGPLLFHLGRRVLKLHILCGLCVTLNLLKDKLLGRSMPIGTIQVLPQRGHASIVVA